MTSHRCVQVVDTTRYTPMILWRKGKAKGCPHCAKRPVRVKRSGES